VNPDNRDVENQVLSLGFSHFERLVGESRPFFSEGRNYLPFDIFTSQRIPRFDTGLKVYGPADSKTNFSLLDAAQPGELNATAFGVQHRPDSLTYLTGGFTDMNSIEGSGTTSMVSANRSIGTGGVWLNEYRTSDSQAGEGWSQNFGTDISDKKGVLNASGLYISTSPQYFTRLGYTPEVDMKGYNTSVSYGPSYEKGLLRSFNFFLTKEQYRHQDNTPYRNSFDAEGSINVRNRFSFRGGYNQADFEGLIDRIRSFSLSFPENNPYRNLTLNRTWGFYNGNQPYRSTYLSGTYRIGTRLDLNLSQQFQDFQGYSDQTIFGYSLDLKHDQLLGGRLIKQYGKVDWYISYSRSGNAGAETYVALGDPNSPSFRASLIVKVVWPLEVLLHKPHRS